MLARIAAFAIASIAAATSLARAQDAPPSGASVLISSFTVGDVDPTGKVPTVNGGHWRRRDQLGHRAAAFRPEQRHAPTSIR